jgi:hypothetical protein
MNNNNNNNNNTPPTIFKVCIPVVVSSDSEKDLHTTIKVNVPSQVNIKNHMEAMEVVEYMLQFLIDKRYDLIDAAEKVHDHDEKYY